MSEYPQYMTGSMMREHFFAHAALLCYVDELPSLETFKRFNALPPQEQIPWLHKAYNELLIRFKRCGVCGGTQRNDFNGIGPDSYIPYVCGCCNGRGLHGFWHDELNPKKPAPAKEPQYKDGAPPRIWKKGNGPDGESTLYIKGTTAGRVFMLTYWEPGITLYRGYVYDNGEELELANEVSREEAISAVEKYWEALPL